MHPEFAKGIGSQVEVIDLDNEMRAAGLSWGSVKLFLKKGTGIAHLYSGVNKVYLCTELYSSLSIGKTGILQSTSFDVCQKYQGFPRPAV